MTPGGVERLSLDARPVRGHDQRALRALVAAGLAILFLLLLALAGAPHVHDGHLRGAERCAACVVRGAEAVASQVPDLAPAPAVEPAPVLAPGASPVTGAPQGAIPGQSPPSAA